MNVTVTLKEVPEAVKKDLESLQKQLEDGKKLNKIGKLHNCWENLLILLLQTHFTIPLLMIWAFAHCPWMPSQQHYVPC